MQVKVLGTVAPYPKGDMNCPGFLVTGVNEDKVLLDCGPGSTRLLDMLKDLRDLTIIISHYHKDHYGDLLPLAYATYVNHKLGYLDKPVDVYLPKPNKYSKDDDFVGSSGWELVREEVIIDYTYLKSLAEQGYFNFHEYDEKAKLNIGSMEVSFSLNNHPINTYAAKVHEGNETLVYTSDTGLPNESLENFIKNADALIAEATYLRGMANPNHDHLYAYEAARMARRAQVRNLYLFHTYPEIAKELYRREGREHFSRTKILREGEIFAVRKEL